MPQLSKSKCFSRVVSVYNGFNLTAIIGVKDGDLYEP